METVHRYLKVCKQTYYNLIFSKVVNFQSVWHSLLKTLEKNTFRSSYKSKMVITARKRGNESIVFSRVCLFVLREEEALYLNITVQSTSSPQTCSDLLLAR